MSRISMVKINALKCIRTSLSLILTLWEPVSISFVILLPDKPCSTLCYVRDSPYFGLLVLFLTMLHMNYIIICHKDGQSGKFSIIVKIPLVTNYSVNGTHGPYCWSSNAIDQYFSHHRTQIEVSSFVHPADNRRTHVTRA